MRKIGFMGFILFILLGGVFAYQNAWFSDGRLHLIFCDVGQGDAIFSRTPSGKDILVDAGPNNSVLGCLTKHMPFWDKTIELAILTHPHADHLNGFLSVLRNYKVLSFVTEDLKNNTAGFNSLIDKIKSNNLHIQYVYAGDRFRFADGVNLKIVGPSKEFLEKTSPGGFIGERAEFASLETLIEFKDFSALLTGDSQASELADAHQPFDSARGFSTVSVLQVPHHGSKTGLDEEFLNTANPKLAVISLGKYNKYGHPSLSTLELLKNKAVKTVRTDEHGEIEITTDGSSWVVK